MSEINDADRTFALNGSEIEFNEYSYIHILSRHYAEIIKQTPSNKTYHIPDFSPDEIVLQLKGIFEKLTEASDKFKGQSIQEVNFRFKGNLYRIWINERIKSIKGKGNVKYNRLETFFPLGAREMLEDLGANYIEEKITGEISVFIKRP